MMHLAQCQACVAKYPAHHPVLLDTCKYYFSYFSGRWGITLIVAMTLRAQSMYPTCVRSCERSCSTITDQLIAHTEFCK